MVAGRQRGALLNELHRQRDAIIDQMVQGSSANLEEPGAHAMLAQLAVVQACISAVRESETGIAEAPVIQARRQA